MRICVLTDPSSDWDRYAESHPGAGAYHKSAWPRVMREQFGQATYFLEARDSRSVICGILPLVRQPGPVFGSCITSLPYLTYGGAVADREEISIQLMDEARALAVRLRSRYLELRDTMPRSGSWSTRMDKVSMVLELPSTSEDLLAGLSAKLRSQVRRPDREGLRVRRGGMELVGDFHAVFRKNMHALGTPVLPVAFFEGLIEAVPEQCELLTMESGGVAVAAAFLVRHRNTVEVPWAACTAEAKPKGFNMRLYWEALSLAVEAGARRFDFGRTTPGSGTYRFKEQWGAKPTQLYWHRWERAGLRVHPATSEDPLRQKVAAIWKKLPESVANRVGPLISPRLPW